MRFLKSFFKFIAYTVGILLLIFGMLAIYVVSVSDAKPPHIADTSAFALQVAAPEGTLRTIGDNWLRQNEFGLWEMYVSGAPFERGVKNGKLSAALITDQEAAFTKEIKRMVPSEGYLKFLKYMVGFMNRDLPEHVTEEYKEEIYGISHAAADSFDWIGNNYARILNYHAAHDIGHALQNMMLVGCTSFGAWGSETETGEMLLGRNFDFWVGDDFAEHKIVAFYRPDQGHPFAFVTWGGFTGVVSGMNDKGLTVTLNAARSDIPFGAATPVSLVAREVLQYAGNIDEAIAICHRRRMFVSESLMVGSAADRKAVVIEKTPDTLAVYDPKQNQIQCTNHYQSDFFKNNKLNQEQMANSASRYRMQRLQELLHRNYPLTPQKMAAILRDRRGLGDENIGNGNEKAVNQLIAHHSVIFMPDSLKMWVSTSPWQLGTYVCYDLRKIFALHGLQHDVDVASNAENLPADTFLNTQEYRDFLKFRQNKMALLHHQPVDTAVTVHSNPFFYDAYRVAGDYCVEKEWYQAAIPYYQQALKLEVATVEERKAIEKKIVLCRKKLNG